MFVLARRTFTPQKLCTWSGKEGHTFGFLRRICTTWYAFLKHFLYKFQTKGGKKKPYNFWIRSLKPPNTIKIQIWLISIEFPDLALYWIILSSVVICQIMFRCFHVGMGLLSDMTIFCQCDHLKISTRNWELIEWQIPWPFLIVGVVMHFGTLEVLHLSLIPLFPSFTPSNFTCNVSSNFDL